MSRLPKGLCHIFGSSMINKVVVFFSGILLVRILPKNEYGTYAYVLNIISTAEIFTAMGMVSGTFQLCSENANSIETKDRIYKYGSAFGWRFNLSLALILFLASFIIPFPLSSANQYVRFAFLMPLTSVLVEFQNIRLRSDFRTREYAISNMTTTFLVSIFTVCGAYIYQGRGALLLRSVAYAVTFIIILFKFGVGISFNMNTIGSYEKKDLFSISIISMINTGLSQLLYIVDIYVIGAVIAEDTLVASYKISTAIPTALSFIPASVVIYIYPYFASHKDDMEWVWRKYLQTASILFLGNILLVVALFLPARSIISFLFGQAYDDSVFSFRVLLINYFVTASFKLLIGNIMVMLRRLKYNLFETLLSSGANIVADIFLVQRYSIEGAAIATLLITSVVSIISLGYLYILYRGKKTR